MTCVPDVFRVQLGELNNKLNEVLSMAHVVEALMDGDISKAPKDEYVALRERDAGAIYYMTTNLCAEIRDVVAAFERDFFNPIDGGENVEG